MKNPILLGFVWVATVALAFYAGGNLRSETPARGDRPAPEDRAAPETPSVRTPDARAAPETPANPAASTGTAEPPKPVVVVPGMKPGDFSTAFMEYAQKMLAQGPEGQKLLFRELDRLVQDKGMEELFRDEAALQPLFYPWVKFLVQHDREIFSMMETVYKTAAEDPKWFEGTSRHTFEAFTEGAAFLLPGAVSEEQLARLRAYAMKIIERTDLPEALEENRDELVRDLEWWSPPLTQEQVLALFADPNVPPAKKLAYLKRTDPAALRGVNVSGIVADAVRAGDSNALWMLNRMPKGTIDAAVLDPVILDALAKGDVSSYEISTYFESTGRDSWDAVRPFLQTGFQRGGAAAEACAQCLCYMGDIEPPKEFVRGVLTTYTLSDETKSMLKGRFGIE